MSDENENNNAVTEDHKNGEMLVHYNDDESYNSAIAGFREELDKQIVFAGESTDWREIRKRLSDLRDKLKTLFLRSEDDKQINELIQSTLENINLRQNEEQEKFDAEAQANYDSIIDSVKEALEYSEVSFDFKKSRERLLSAQDTFKNLKLRRSQKDELYKMVNAAFDNVSKKQNEERENYEMECIENYHNLKHKIDIAISFSKESEIFADARKALINVQNLIKGLKLKRDQRNELYQFIRDAFDEVNIRQEAERTTFNQETSDNYDKLKITVSDAIAFAESNEDFGLAREQLINVQNQIKSLKLKREHRDELFADIRAVFENLNQKQSVERDTYDAECAQNYERLTEKVNDCFGMVHGLTEFNMIRETLITVQGEVRITRLKKEQRIELFSRIREAFSLFDKKKNEYFDQRRDEKSKKLLEIKINLEDKMSRLNDVMAKDLESLELQKVKLAEAGEDEFLIEEVKTKIRNIEGRIKEKQDIIDQAQARVAEIDLEVNKL